MIPVILDCTLRDGGYVNNWEFDTKTARSVISGLYDSGIRCVEIGIMGANARRGLQTKFTDFSEMEPLLEGRRSDCRYAVMFTTENASGCDVPERSEKTPDIIRLAYFKRDLNEALAAAGSFKKKGYEVFLQAMATFMYSEDELKAMLERVNALGPSAFYLVDSFSTMYPSDVRKARDLILDRLNDNIALGFHAHNNIQMAFANVLEFLDTEVTGRQLYTDSSIFGMGRGAGNVPTELLMERLNSKGAGFDIPAVLSVYQKHLEPVFRQYGWGYGLPYYLTASYRTNSAYGWYFLSHGITDILLLEKALTLIPDELRFALKTDIADNIIKEVVNNE